MDDGEADFDPRIISLTYLAKEGCNVESKDGIVVSLDLILTPELIQEGISRDIIRTVQEARKQLGCEITERIYLSVDSMSTTWVELICAETLADIKNNIENANVEFTIKNELGNDIKVKVCRQI